MCLNEESIIGDILDADSACEDIFLARGMACMGCPSARGETVLEACQIHGVDCGQLLAELRSHFGSC